MRERALIWAKRIFVALIVGIPAGAAFMFLSVEVTSQPGFCGSCHVMTPYYESWKTSSHKEVLCIECHIPPGVVSEARKKYEALAMVARYFTGTYSTNPWAEVDDESCLRSGCHSKRVLLGRELFQGVLFDHQPHLTEMRREKRLRCTSCHSQIVQGSHIKVTPSTCFLCHFKNTPLNEGTARCRTCHEVPEKIIQTGGLAFDHSEVKRLDMNCTACHQGVVRGEGEVPRERCYTCHNDEERLSLYEQTEFLHRNHVTDHKVECLNCHIEIVHKIPAREEALTMECRSCHSSSAGHSAVRDLYRGLGAKGVPPRPAAMYLAGVRCEACHNASHAEDGRANEVSCMSCHGPKYLAIYRSWQLGLARRLEGAKKELQEAVRKVGSGGDAAQQAALKAAEADLALVERGHGIHNPGYAVSIFEGIHRASASALGASAASPPPWTEAPYKADCLNCHFGIEYLSSPVAGRDFPHGRHVVTARLRCTVCHEGRDRHGVMKIGAADCDRCHNKIRTPMTGLSAEECLKCHAANLGEVSTKVRFPHDQHIDNGVDCETCHAGVGAKPHREFARSAGAMPKLGHDFCATCHAGDVPTDAGMPDGADCTKCHVDF